MKKTNTAIKAVGLLFFIALLTYLAVYIAQALDNPFTTAPAVSYTVRNSAELSGIIVRDEKAITSAYNTVYITAVEGKVVSKGGEIASAFGSDEDLQKAVHINELKTEMNQLEAMQNSENSTSDKLQQDTTISENILALKSAVCSKNFSNLEDKSIQLRTLVFTGVSSTANIQAQIDELKTEISKLNSTESMKATKIYAAESGLFSTAVDGWEDLGSKEIKGISASDLSQLLTEKKERPQNALGKVIRGTKWYYASVMKRDDCVNLNKGDHVNLMFGRYNDETLHMTVESISRAEDSKCAVVFSSDIGMTDVMNLRQQDSELVFNEFTGLRVPKKSVHVDGDGKTCVFVQTALQAEKKYVVIKYDLGDFYVVNDDGTNGQALNVEGEKINDSLRAGDQIIVTAKDLYNGKVVD